MEPDYELETKIEGEGKEILVMSVSLPGVKSCADVELDVLETQVCLQDKDRRYKLELTLPRPIDHTKVRAKWKKKQEKLRVSMPVANESESESEGAQEASIEGSDASDAPKNAEATQVDTEEQEKQEKENELLQSLAAVELEQHLVKQADSLKAEGNAFVKQSKFRLAVEKYTEAIELVPSLPTSAVYFSNRAQAHIKMEAFGLAISDGRNAIQLDPTYVKAHYRVGSAHVGLGPS